MTELELRNLVVNTAKAYLGAKESNGSHKKIIDLYNSHRPLARGYAVKYTDAWCATFVSAVGIKLGLTDIMPTECGCGKMIQLYKNKGRWKETDSYVPEPGDIIMYDWGDSGKGDNTGDPEHVGIVVSVSGSTIKVIEGNISNAVGYRNIAVNGRYIRGYCLPDYASKATTTATKPETTVTNTTKPNVTTNKGGALSKDIDWYGVVATRSDPLNVRTWAGTQYGTCSFSPLAKGTKVGVCDSVKASDGTVWYYVKVGSKYGFVSGNYIKKA